MTHPAGGASADPSAPAPRRLRQLGNAALFLAIFAGGCALLRALAPFPEVPGIYPKWRYLREHRDRYNLLFVGSSRFYHQIIPAQFDAAAAAAGIEVRSFNFGYDAMWPPESFYLLRQVLALRPARLKWVVFDLMEIKTQLDARNESTLRTAYWHDPRHTALAFRNILASKGSPQRQRELLVQHGRLCLQQLLNLGRGADLIEKRLAPKERRKPYSWAHREGFEPEPGSGLFDTARSNFLANVDRAKRLLRPLPIPPVFYDALNEIIGEVRAAGIEPLFVITPTVDPTENITGVPGGVPVFAFNDPAEFPVLFDPVNHFDAYHLNESGAVAFTEVLSRRFIAHAKPRP